MQRVFVASMPKGRKSEMKKYSNVQLSRILSVSAIGLLDAPSFSDSQHTVCIEQAAHATLESDPCKEHMNTTRANVYDNWRLQSNQYVRQSPDLMLGWMEKQGMA